MIEPGKHYLHLPSMKTVKALGRITITGDVLIHIEERVAYVSVTTLRTVTGRTLRHEKP